MKNKYDVCVIAFLDLRFDGRAKNLINSLLQQGKNVISFSIELPSFVEEKQHPPTSYTQIIIDIPHHRRVIIKLLTFIQSVKNHLSQIECDVLWFSDFYSLPLIQNAKNVHKTIYDSREIYTALGALHKSGIRQYVVARLERKYIKSVNVLVTSGKRDSEHLIQLYNLKIPVYEIYNYPKYTETAHSNAIRASLSIPTNKTVLLYQGILSEGRGLIPAMEALKLDIDVTNRYVLVVLGGGNDIYQRYLLDYAKQIGVSHKVYFVGQVAYSELHAWTCSADIGLCNIEPISFSYQMALPNKLFEYMLAELPVLATDLPAIAEIVQATGCGKLVSSINEPSEIFDAIEWLRSQQQTIKNNIRKAKMNYTYETQCDLIHKIIE